MTEFSSRHARGLALEHVYHWERSTPDRVYLTQPMGGGRGGRVRDFTWREAIGEARRMAAHLRSLDLPPGSHIALLGKNTAGWLLADLAIWMAGHVTVPLYPTLSAETARQILEHSEARLLFLGKLDVWEVLRDAIPPALPRITLPLSPPVDAPRWDDLVAATAPIEDDPVRAADDLATIIYTSGSTGTPKGVMITFGAIASCCFGVDRVFEFLPEDRVLSHLPLAHVAERCIVECSSFFSGFHVYFAESLDTFVDDLRRARPTLFLTVPRLWQKFQLGIFAKMPPENLDRLLRIPLVSWFVRKKVLRALGLEAVRIAGSGSAPMPADLLSWYRRLGLELIEAYGMTENFVYSHASRLGRVRPGYVGEPYPGVESRISDEGEIQVKSPGAMKGYFKAPELTAEAFTADGFLRTGDRGEVDELGRLRITGRVKELFKTSKGKYVAPAPLENRIASNPLVEAVCVSGPARPKPFALLLLGAEAKKKSATQGGKAEVEASLAATLAEVNASVDPHEALAFFAIVRDEWQVENGFLTPSLKIKRAVIERVYESEVDAWYAAGRTVIWQE
ncbi:MAG TPA: AMP-binding protein [Thermoanaerobaculia bacterium]|nr:AMP-binding protein [Thermoanaerobaculia bacterium]